MFNRCGGDDSGEYYDGKGSCDGTHACCNNANDVVVGGKCKQTCTGKDLTCNNIRLSTDPNPLTVGSTPTITAAVSNNGNTAVENAFNIDLDMELDGTIFWGSTKQVTGLVFHFKNSCRMYSQFILNK